MVEEEKAQKPVRSAPRSKRKGGAQPGNLNALKHGFYSRRFREQDSTDLEVFASAQGFQDEIKLLKVMIRRVFEIAEDEGEDTLDNWIKALSACGAAMARQASLLRSQAKTGGDSDDVASAISQAIGEVTREFACK